MYCKAKSVKHKYKKIENEIKAIAKKKKKKTNLMWYASDSTFMDNGEIKSL